MKGDRDAMRKSEEGEKKKNNKTKTKKTAKFLAVYICIMRTHMEIEELKVGISESVQERIAACTTWNSAQFEWHW